MNDLVDYYQQQVSPALSSNAWLRRTQEEAVQEFCQLGLPGRQHEDWKYTSVDELIKQRFKFREKNTSLWSGYKQNEVPVGLKLMLQNGALVGLEALRACLPPGMLVLPLTEAVVSHEDKVTPYLGAALKIQHGFHALNTAMLQDGVFIYVPKGVKFEEPLLLSHWQSVDNQVVYLRHLVVMEEESALTLIEDYDGDAATSYLTNTVTEVHLKASSTLTHYKIQRESQLAYHLGHLAVIQAEKSHFMSHSISIGGKVVRSDLTIDLCAPNAKCFMNGVYVQASGQHVDHHTLVNHLSAHCESSQDYKGILMGRSRAVFNGRVMVAPHAQKTIAKQQNKNLLLSTNAEIDTKPELNIFADDVVCSHGATVGQLDEEALFYLATRGIDRMSASEYLIRAFTVENFRALQHEELRDWISALLNQHLRGAHDV